MCMSNNLRLFVILGRIVVVFSSRWKNVAASSTVILTKRAVSII